MQQVFGKVNRSPPPKESKKEVELSKPSKMKKAPAEEKSFVRDLSLPNESAWENLKVEDGVTIVEHGKRKAGRRFTSISVSNSAQVLPTLSTHPLDITGKITMTEYKTRIKEGNLSREPSKAGLDETMTDNKALVEKLLYEVVNPQPKKPSKPRRVHSIDMRVMPDTSNMKVHSTKLLENLLKVEMDPIFPKKPTEVSHLAPVLDAAPRITTVDQFNLKIINTKEWGVNVPLPSTGAPLSFSKLKHRNFKASMGELFKPHRTRGLLNSSMMTPSHYLNASSSEFLKGSQSPSHSINSISNLTLMK